MSLSFLTSALLNPAAAQALAAVHVHKGKRSTAKKNKFQVDAMKYVGITWHPIPRRREFSQLCKLYCPTRHQRLGVLHGTEYCSTVLLLANGGNCTNHLPVEQYASRGDWHTPIYSSMIHVVRLYMYLVHGLVLQWSAKLPLLCTVPASKFRIKISNYVRVPVQRLVVSSLVGQYQ